MCPVRTSSCVLRHGLFQYHFLQTRQGKTKMLSAEESASIGKEFLHMVCNGLSVGFMYFCVAFASTVTLCCVGRALNPYDLNESSMIHI